MTSIRVPPRLLGDLHDARPVGVPLASLLHWLLQEAGGPVVVRERMIAERHRQAAKAQVARLRQKDHRSVMLEEGQQVALAEAAGLWARRQVKDGAWRKRGPRAVVYLGVPEPDRSRIHFERTGVRP